MIKMKEILKHPLSTEKSIRLMEQENVLVFVVEEKSNKAEIKAEFERMFKAKVATVNTLFNHDGRKRAYIKLKPETQAIDIATQLGLM